ncbi:creatininase family protein [Salinicola tamaricis]|uniref:creatininase family protein n=1 Tax=Salinicola tamaricis TaxID=1771309 RepID=UPI001F5D60E2|nr:creatininase family protein [Salinicola tamaricis]
MVPPITLQGTGYDRRATRSPLAGSDRPGAGRAGRRTHGGGTAAGGDRQHGAHLPLSTDLDIGLGLLAAATSELENHGLDSPGTVVVVLPPLALGASSLEHTAFCGTLSLMPEAAIGVIEALGERGGEPRRYPPPGVVQQPRRQQGGVIDLAALKLRAAHGMLVVKANYFRFPPAEALPAEELRHGLHGGALETAMMLHLAPGRCAARR